MSYFCFFCKICERHSQRNERRMVSFVSKVFLNLLILLRNLLNITEKFFCVRFKKNIYFLLHLLVSYLSIKISSLVQILFIQIRKVKCLLFKTIDPFYKEMMCGSQSLSRTRVLRTRQKQCINVVCKIRFHPQPFDIR